MKARLSEIEGRLGKLREEEKWKVSVGREEREREKVSQEKRFKRGEGGELDGVYGGLETMKRKKWKWMEDRTRNCA